MHNALAVIGGLILVGAALPYIVQTLRGETHPNIVTWSIWTLLNIITTVVTLSDGAVQTAIFTGASTIGTGTIALASLRYGVARYTWFDGVCLLLALLSIVLWRITNEPGVAIAINLVADFFAILPTIRHAWREPWRETWQTFAISTLGSTVILLSMSKHTFVSVALPAWFLVTDLLLLMIIKSRRQRFPQPVAVDAE